MTTDTTPRPYGTPHTPHVTVRGEAHLETEPETARVTITLTARGTDRRTALDALTRRNTQTIDLIKTYDDAIEKLETGALTITPELTHRGRAERIRAYHGRVLLTATLNDFTALGELTTRLADHDLTRIDGPLWALRPDSPVHRLARRHAVHDAVQRAREYAEALDTRIGALLELADTGTGRTAARPARPAFGGRFTLSAAGEQEFAAAEPEPIDLEPVRQTVHAQVEARFTLEPPALH